MRPAPSLLDQAHPPPNRHEARAGRGLGLGRTICLRSRVQSMNLATRLCRVEGCTRACGL